MQYTASTTKVTETAVAKLAEAGIAKPWTNPRTGKVRHYINLDGLAKLIGLEQPYYKSGNVSGCSYVDIDGDKVTVANSRAYGSYAKTYIEDGTVHTTWSPYGADIAELIAVRANEDAEEEQEQTEPKEPNEPTEQTEQTEPKEPTEPTEDERTESTTRASKGGIEGRRRARRIFGARRLATGRDEHTATADGMKDAPGVGDRPEDGVLC